jgi:hypothetical protein
MVKMKTHPEAKVTGGSQMTSDHGVDILPRSALEVQWSLFMSDDNSTARSDKFDIGKANTAAFEFVRA